MVAGTMGFGVSLSGPDRMTGLPDLATGVQNFVTAP